MTLVDQLIGLLDNSLRTLFSPAQSARQNPATNMIETITDEADRKKSAALMRINHVGEVCAQALYRGQAMSTDSNQLKAIFEKSAEEETDHLAWCETRLNELNAHASYLNPLWYAGAFTLGMLAGAFGNQWNLGFVVETERQVEMHLRRHLSELPPSDQKSQLILEQMIQDEMQHASVALDHGAVELPDIVKRAMRFFSKIMTTTAYWV